MMGIHVLPNMNKCWSSVPYLKVEGISNIMPKSRLNFFVEKLHINDNRTYLGNKLHKVQTMLDIIRQNSQLAYNPSKMLSVDESMIPFGGRSVMKQYMPLKPVKRAMVFSRQYNRIRV